MAEDNNYDDDTESSSTTTTLCRVYDTEDIFTFLVQLILGTIAVVCLYFKRYFEHPRRKFSIWFLDISKQGIGCIYAHILNMLIAGILSRQHATDECGWYGISFLMDTTLGLGLSILFLHQLDAFAKYHQISPLMHLGVYTGDTAVYHWTIQLISWMIILTICKLIIFVLMYLGMNVLGVLSKVLFTIPFSGHRRLELLFVMILMPGVLNVIYFWIADNHLKAGDDETAAHENTDQKKEQLLVALPQQTQSDIDDRRKDWTVFGSAEKSIPPSASV